MPFRTLPELILFRHGPRLMGSEAPNLSNRELPLLPEAQAVLAASAGYVRALGVAAPVRCIAAPAQRTRDTARILVGELAPGLAVETDDRLRERNLRDKREIDALLDRCSSFLHSLKRAPGPVLVATHEAVLEGIAGAFGAPAHHVPMGGFLLWRNGALEGPFAPPL